MGFSEGRTMEQAYIDDRIEVLTNMVYVIPKMVNEKIKSLDDNYKKTAKDSADGDKEIELDYYNQLSGFNPFEEFNYHFYVSFVITIYAFYEKTLRKLFEKYKILLLKNKRDSYAIQFFNSIKKHIENSNLSLNPVVCKLSSVIDKDHRELRNDLTHNKTDVDITLFRNGEYLIEFLDNVKTILLDVNTKLEQAEKTNKKRNIK